MSVPSDPKEFFTRYVPERFAAVVADFTGKTSAGSLAFDIGEAGAWSFRLENGALAVEPGVAADAILRISVAPADFEPLVVKSAARFAGAPAALERQLIALRALDLDAERAQLIRGIAGSVAIVVVDQGVPSRIVLTPGSAAPNLDAPDCELSVDLEDFLALQQGRQNPIELLMANRLRISGNAQIALALSGLFV
jgi:predicted lipid carrier protein YhbT